MGKKNPYLLGSGKVIRVGSWLGVKRKKAVRLGARLLFFDFLWLM